jgi:5-methylcytosine-specific restriction endonuclease McrA
MPVEPSIQSKRAAARRALNRGVYQSPRWRGKHGTRARVLERDNHTCRACGAPATVADHYPLTLRQLLATGRNPYNPDTCRALCLVCSGRSDGGRT